MLVKYAQRDGGLCQWPPTDEPPSKPQPIRTQWCHGAPGMVASLASLAPADEQLTELLVAGGELTWQAGPLKKGAGLCHGTAGNGYAFLKLFERTGDELWLERARRFAMHAIEQVEQARAEHGRGRHSLWTGDPARPSTSTTASARRQAFPTLDYFCTSPNQIRSLNLIREFLGGRGALELVNLVRLAPNQISWPAPASIFAIAAASASSPPGAAAATECARSSTNAR